MNTALRTRLRLALAHAIARPVFWVCPPRFAKRLAAELQDRAEGDTAWSIKEQVLRAFFLKDFVLNNLTDANKTLRSRSRFALAALLARLAEGVRPL